MQRRIDLNGTWELAWYDGQRGTRPRARALGGLPDAHFRLPAQVPGEVHLDLARAGVIGEPDDRRERAGRALGRGDGLVLPADVRRARPRARRTRLADLRPAGAGRGDLSQRRGGGAARQRVLSLSGLT